MNSEMIDKRIPAATKSMLLLAAALLVMPVYAEEISLDAATDAALNKAILGKHRSEKNRARDVYRRPKETLAFFGFRSDMTVVEILPGGGWYTEILAPALRDHGKLYAAHYTANPSQGSGGYQRRNLGRFLSKLGESADTYGKVTVTTLSYPDHLRIAPPGSADLVVTFRNVHNWVAAEEHGGDKAANATFAAMFDALKPGGVLGIVAHRWPDPATEDPTAENGYMSEDRVKALATAAGFEFVDRSDHNRNPQDTHDHPYGVWTLPPSLDGDETDKDHYRKIGESDRMTLKFRKP
jgi:predicted methyltransferase